MHGLMMDYALTVNTIFRRAERMCGRREIVTRLADKSIHRYTYADFAHRTRRLAAALQGLGIQPGDRVATLGWNHSQHLEAYFGIPLAGGVLHTLNLRLHPDELAFIANHAGDRFLIVDECLLPCLERFRAKVNFERIFVVRHSSQTLPAVCEDYEALLDHAGSGGVNVEQARGEPLNIDEDEAAAMCYTSGTTGQPKGVVYSHRALALH